MNHASEPVDCKNLQLARTLFKNKLQKCKSSHLLGRKINACQSVKKCKIKKYNLSPSDHEKGRTDSAKRVVNIKSPGRNGSYHKQLSDKRIKLHLPSFISPPRAVKLGTDTVVRSRCLSDDFRQNSLRNHIRSPVSKILKKTKSKMNFEEPEKFDKPSPISSLNPPKKPNKLKITEKPEDDLKDCQKSKNLKKFSKKIGLAKRKKNKEPEKEELKTSKLRSNESGENRLASNKEKVRRAKKGTELFSTMKLKDKTIDRSEEQFYTKDLHGEVFNSFSRKPPRKAKISHEKKTEKIKEKKTENSKKKQPKVNKKSRSLWIDNYKILQSFYKKKKPKVGDKSEINLESKENHRENIKKIKLRASKTKKSFRSGETFSQEYSDKSNRFQNFLKKKQCSLDISFTSFENGKISQSASVRMSPKLKSSSDLNSLFANSTFPQPAEDEQKKKLTFSEINKSKLNPSLLESTIKQALHPSLIAKELNKEASNSSNQNSSRSDEHDKNPDSESQDFSMDWTKQTKKPDTANKSSSQISEQSEVNLKEAKKAKEEDLSKDETNSNKKTSEKILEENIKICYLDSLEDLEDPSPLKVCQEVDEKDDYEKLKSEIIQEVADFEAEKKTKKQTHQNNGNLKKVPELITSYKDLFDKVKNISAKASDEIMNSIPFLIESPRLISDHSYDDLSYKESDSNDSHSSDAEISLKNIINNNTLRADEIIDRPEHNMIKDSDSSNDETCSNFHLYNKPTSETEERISSPNSLQGFSKDLQKIIDEEIVLFINFVKFSVDEKDVEPSLEYIEKYLNRLELKFKGSEDEILEIINTPAVQDPLSKLETLQNDSARGFNRFPVLEMLLPQELSIELKLDYDCLNKANRQVYLQLIFDCVNEALNHIRPFGLNGLPDPWVPLNSTLYGEGSLSTVFKKLRQAIRKWEGVKNGPILVDQSTAEKAAKNKEERLGKMVLQDVRDIEEKWTQYYDEETQIIIDISYSALEYLVEETFMLIPSI